MRYCHADGPIRALPNSTSRISSVAYAVDEMASDANTAQRDPLAQALVFLFVPGEWAPDEHPFELGNHKGSTLCTDERPNR